MQVNYRVIDASYHEHKLIYYTT